MLAETVSKHIEQTWSNMVADGQDGWIDQYVGSQSHLLGQPEFWQPILVYTFQQSTSSNGRRPGSSTPRSSTQTSPRSTPHTRHIRPGVCNSLNRLCYYIRETPYRVFQHTRLEYFIVCCYGLLLNWSERLKLVEAQCMVKECGSTIGYC
jgi:hypothetical protein